MKNQYSREELLKRVELQILESRSELNRYYTWLSLGSPNRAPTEGECLEHYIECGGAEDFARRYENQKDKEAVHSFPG